MKKQSNQPRLMLYGTFGCHLCEQAETLIQSVTDTVVSVVEIADDPQLLDRYAVRIPVLQRLDTGEELGWPFDAAAIRHWLAIRE
jgi:hypothetical protein